jgi:hypothetical protein
MVPISFLSTLGARGGDSCQAVEVACNSKSSRSLSAYAETMGQPGEIIRFTPKDTLLYRPNRYINSLIAEDSTGAFELWLWKKAGVHAAAWFAALPLKVAASDDDILLSDSAKGTMYRLIDAIEWCTKCPQN